MQNRLNAYVRKIIINAAREYAYPKKKRTAESTKSAVADLARGTDTGMWNDMIYTGDVLRMFNRYRSDCAAIISESMSESGSKMSDYADRDETVTFADLIVACACRRPMTWEQYIGDDDRAHAATFAIRYAMESALWNVASAMEIEI